MGMKAKQESWHSSPACSRSSSRKTSGKVKDFSPLVHDCHVALLAVFGTLLNSRQLRANLEIGCSVVLPQKVAAFQTLSQT